MYRATDIAKYIIQKYYSEGRTVSNLKLQKLLYFVQAEFLVSKDEPCFREKIEAWDFGPVVPEVYREFKIFGGANIPVFGKPLRYGYIEESDKKLIDGILDDCAPYSAAALVEITHHQSPWKEAYYEKGGKNNEITTKSIKEYFSRDKNV